MRTIQGPPNGGVSNGGVSRSGLVLTFLSFFVLFGTFPIFPGFSRFARGWSGDFPDSSLFSFSAYQEHLRGTVPKGSATQSGPFPEKSGKRPGLETPRLSFSQTIGNLLLGLVCPLKRALKMPESRQRELASNLTVFFHVFSSAIGF